MVADLEHHPAVGREHLRLLARLGAGRGVGADDRDGVADRLFHQLARRQQVEIEILFDDAGIGGGELHRSEEHTSELQSLMRISYAVFCLKKKKNDMNN